MVVLVHLVSLSSVAVDSSFPALLLRADATGSLQLSVVLVVVYDALLFMAVCASGCLHVEDSPLCIYAQGATQHVPGYSGAQPVTGGLLRGRRPKLAGDNRFAAKYNRRSGGGIVRCWAVGLGLYWQQGW